MGGSGFVDLVLTAVCQCSRARVNLCRSALAEPAPKCRFGFKRCVQEIQIFWSVEIWINLANACFEKTAILH